MLNQAFFPLNHGVHAEFFLLNRPRMLTCLLTLAFFLVGKLLPKKMLWPAVDCSRTHTPLAPSFEQLLPSNATLSCNSHMTVLSWPVTKVQKYKSTKVLLCGISMHSHAGDGSSRCCGVSSDTFVLLYFCTFVPHNSTLAGTHSLFYVCCSL